MHELGVVFHVIKCVNEIAKENNVSHVTKVTLQLGEVSGVVHYQLIDCWNWAVKKETILKDCPLEIETIKAVTFCENCKSEYETVKFAKICPNCGSDNTYLIKGNEFIIKEIETNN
jgi:hydrogenase nickel incorporation protein HypA/HybF